MSEFKGTKGECFIRYGGDMEHDRFVIASRHDGKEHFVCEHWRQGLGPCMDRERLVANATLIVEAFNVVNTTGRTPRELADELQNSLQQSGVYIRRFHEVMDALLGSQMEHGDCKSGDRYGGKPLACTACMAKLKLEEIMAVYKGRTCRLVSAIHLQGMGQNDARRIQ